MRIINLFFSLSLACMCIVSASAERFHFDRSGPVQRCVAGAAVLGGMGYLIHSLCANKQTNNANSAAAKPFFVLPSKCKTSVEFVVRNLLSMSCALRDGYKRVGVKERIKACLGGSVAGLGLAYLWWARRNCISYNPQVRFIPKDDGGESKDLSLYLHGWGESGDGVQSIAKELPGTVVQFDFPDAQCAGSSPEQRVNLVTQSSFGQLPDVLVAIKTLNDTIKTKNPNRVFLHGYSRGAAAATGMRRVLAEVVGNQHTAQSQSWMNDLDRLGVTRDDCRSMLERIMKGGCVLECPLSSAKTKIERDFRGPLSPLVQACLVLLSRYSPWGLHADAADAQLGDVPTLVFFEKNDRVVGNSAANQNLINLLRRNAADVALAEGQDPSGHCHERDQVCRQMHEFFHARGRQQ